MTPSKLESVQTNIVSEKRLAEQEKCLAQREKRLAERENRLAEQEKRLAAEQEKLLLQAQTAGWFAADQCGHCMSNVQPLQFPNMSLPQKLRQVSAS